MGESEMELSIQDLGSVGEFVSSIAVILTLIYLAVQTRQTQKMIRGKPGNLGRKQRSMLC